MRYYDTAGDRSWGRSFSSFVLLLALLAPGPSLAAEIGRTVQADGIERRYVVHVPPRLPDGQDVPLVLVLHGGGGDAGTAAKQTHFNDAADLESFIAVYPEGSDRPRPILRLLNRRGFFTWNAGACCGYAMEHRTDDVGFLRRVVAAVSRDYRIDPRRIYAAGISNGGMMAYRLACEASDIIAGVGVVSGVLVFQQCAPAKPVSVIDFHGTDDQYVPIDGGVGRKSLTSIVFPPVRDTISFWAGVDQCQARRPVAPTTVGVLELEYGSCAFNTAVVYYVIDGAGHAWPGGERISFLLDPPPTAISATPLTWRFFAAHPRS